MISKQELLQLRAEWQLDVGVIEKDYVLGWVLAAIAAEPALAEHWIFKGGTCLRKCYYETYRFSEDLDFTVIDGGPEEPEELTAIFERVAEWLRRGVRNRAARRDRLLRAAPQPPRQPDDAGPARLPRAQPTADAPQAQARHHQRRGCSSSSPCCARSSTPTATAHSRQTACFATRSRSSPPRRHERSPSGVGRATSTTSSTCTATPTCSVSPHVSRACSHRSARTSASPSRTPTHPRLAIRRTRSSGSGRTCSATSFRDHCRHSRSSGTRSTRSSPGSTAHGHAPHSAAPNSDATSTRLDCTARDHLMATRHPARDHPLRGREPPQGRDRLPRRAGTQRSAHRRAILAAAHAGRQPRPIRRQRPRRSCAATESTGSQQYDQQSRRFGPSSPSSSSVAPRDARIHARCSRAVKRERPRDSARRPLGNDLRREQDYEPTHSSPLPIYTRTKAFMRPWVMPHNRPPQARTYGNGGAKCACCSRCIRRGCGYDRACGGDRRRRSDGDDAGG